jgi:hypothetical protein
VSVDIGYRGCLGGEAVGWWSERSSQAPAPVADVGAVERGVYAYRGYLPRAVLPE